MELTINDFRAHETRKKFKDIPVGTVFEAGIRGSYYLKTSETPLLGKVVANAVCLAECENYMCWDGFQDDVLVVELKADLNIFTLPDKILASVKSGGQNW